MVMQTEKRHDTTVTFIGKAAALTSWTLPLLNVTVPAGFPSPADDYTDRGLDLNELMIKHPAATFFVRVEGESMLGAGISSGDLLVVDRALEIRDNSIVVAVVDGEFTVKRLSKKGTKTFLTPENPDYESIELSSDMNVAVWGVVTNVIHSYE